MPCGCNSICDNDCAANQLCTGHVSACVNSYAFTGIIIGDIVRASHILELQTAIDSERTDATRRYNASNPAYCSTHTPGDLACTNNDFSAYSWTAGVGVYNRLLRDHFNDVKEANNEVVTDSGYGGSVVSDFIAQSVDSVNSVILASAITELQTKINQTRNACICDSHCNCDPSDCGCNGECPSDDAYYS